ncbi:MAG: valine--tRNA ligase [Methanomicrobia archaeon]|nr:valine--tRNA ligase [Methanomicrobia archaeon]
MKKAYEHEEIEGKWLEKSDDSIYYFDASSDKPPYIIDTPPPYPTGDFHIGNALNWCYIDFIARYKRMRGYEVMFPQGWDCHGLPTEVKVEEIHGTSRHQISTQEFRELCRQLTGGNIEQMKGMMRRLGMSIDWSKEYVTMDDRYKRYTQLSFLKMYRGGLIYQAEHPVNWCPRCETAIAFAEVEYEDRDAYLNYLLFERAGAEKEAEHVEIEIATTRPELLASCVAVAVHPDDERYKTIVEKELEVPIFEHKVKVYEDESVDPEFGTGVVMICTFGDRQDVRWWKLHNLPLRASIDERGRMTEVARGYEELSVEECKQKIIEDLDAKGLLKRREGIKQNVGVCWRCKTPIEIISTKQWFVRVKKEEILNAAREIKWYPEHFRIRLENWVESMDWDWCISRQRIFGVPIPVWYCKQCGTVKIADEEEIPVDPVMTSPEEPCVNCGGTEFEGEKDVLDTWMDSSLTALWAAGWSVNASSGIEFEPVELRPQGHDIIRTWAFYSILRSIALTKKIPWRTILINGMVLGEDGYKMSKSRSNTVSPDYVIQKHGADVFRQWAAIGGAVGSDVQFQWKDIVAASKFMQKLWNILRFAMIHLSDYEKPFFKKEGFTKGKSNLRVVDKWLLSKLNRLILSVTDSMENFKFDEAMKDIRAFAWNVLADDYIELVKSRLYGRSGDEGKESAKYALHEAIKTLSILLAPFVPFYAEEMYSQIAKGEREMSVHKAKWQEVKPDMFDSEAENEGDLIADIVRAVRRYKSERGIPLSAPLGKIEVYVESLDTEDIENATATKVELCKSMSEIKSEGDILDVNGTKVVIIKEVK